MKPMLAVMWPVLASLALLPAVAFAGPDDFDLSQWTSTEQNRGRITIGFQSAHTDGGVDGEGNPGPGVRTDTHNLLLALDYHFKPKWSLHVSLPYVHKRSLGDPGLHNPALLARPRDGEFLDDGDWHGAWQDWQFGTTYHGHWRGFAVRPHAVLTWPSHDYTFFASAAPGRRLKSLRVGADISRRIGRSNVHWSTGYSYEFVENVMGMSLDKQHYRLSTRWDLSPTWSLNAFATARYSQGIEPRDLAGMVPRSELWYQHDRLLEHNYVLAGIGATWRFGEHWALSGSTSRPLHAESMHRLRSTWDVLLSRSF